MFIEISIVSVFRDLIFKPDGSIYSQGDILKLPKLAATLERIANGNGSEFYTGSLSVDVLKDLQEISRFIYTRFP